ncbi:GNAT family N-acetyltransferase [Rufibacter roseus]|uniref:GNAT family N-acetyltransferase n=1 Tax=Rufibacter roseus TaxID=1567108 RepID=A0ABW2DRM1_9BACT|nr:GNAT family N-acetyltransferase [Rufibacter roseus]
MKLQITHDQDDLRFYASLDQEEAELTYFVTEDNVLDFDYTFVPENYRNQGLADQLVETALRYVKENNLKFTPSCPVVEAYANRHPEYQEFMVL